MGFFNQGSSESFSTIIVVSSLGVFSFVFFSVSRIKMVAYKILKGRANGDGPIGIVQGESELLFQVALLYPVK